MSNRHTPISTTPLAINKLQILVYLVVFMVAFGVRFLSWQDNHRDVLKVETLVTSDYEDSARQLSGGDLRAFISDLNHMEHPPGYSILIAGIFRTVGESNTAIQFFQIAADSVAALIALVIAFELVPVSAPIAGFLVALSPQLSYYSLLLLPDSITAVPILLSVYLLILSCKRPRMLTFILSGGLVGISCWLRPNGLLLAPFLAAVVPITVGRGRRLRYMAALVLAAMVAMAPITVKNALVFHRFVPLSLGVGQKLLQGIAEYDEQERFNIPKTDLGIMRQEAEWYGRSDYAQWLFGADGIARDRMRVRRGMAVIRSHPLWYSGVMLRRGISFFRLSRVPVIASEAPVSHQLNTSDVRPVWSSAPAELLGGVSPGAQASSVTEQTTKLLSDNTKYGPQLTSPQITVAKQSDYLLRLPVKLEDGRVSVKITDLLGTRELSSAEIDLVEGVSSQNQPLQTLEIPFVSGDLTQIRVVVANNAPRSARSIVELHRFELFDLGRSSQTWMHYPRLILRGCQRLFITAIIVPFTVLGTFLLIRSRNSLALLLLLIVPAYYVLIQSALHTERRYVLVMQYFFLILAAVALSWFLKLLASVLSLLAPARK